MKRKVRDMTEAKNAAEKELDETERRLADVTEKLGSLNANKAMKQAELDDLV